MSYWPGALEVFRTACTLARENGFPDRIEWESFDEGELMLSFEFDCSTDQPPIKPQLAMLEQVHAVAEKHGTRILYEGNLCDSSEEFMRKAGVFFGQHQDLLVSDQLDSEVCELEEIILLVSFAKLHYGELINLIESILPEGCTEEDEPAMTVVHNVMLSEGDTLPGKLHSLAEAFGYWGAWQDIPVESVEVSGTDGGVCVFAPRLTHEQYLSAVESLGSDFEGIDGLGGICFGILTPHER